MKKKSDFELLKERVELLGVAQVASALGFRDTGRIKNWLIRKDIPKEFLVSVKNYLSTKGETK